MFTHTRNLITYGRNNPTLQISQLNDEGLIKRQEKSISGAQSFLFIYSINTKQQTVI